MPSSQNWDGLSQEELSLTKFYQDGFRNLEDLKIELFSRSFEYHRRENKQKKCTQEGSLLHRVMITSTEETFQSFSHEIDSVSLDTLHYPERSSETEVDSVNHPKNKDLMASREGLRDP